MAHLNHTLDLATMHTILDDAQSHVAHGVLTVTDVAALCTSVVLMYRNDRAALTQLVPALAALVGRGKVLACDDGDYAGDDQVLQGCDGDVTQHDESMSHKEEIMTNGCRAAPCWKVDAWEDAQRLALAHYAIPLLLGYNKNSKKLGLPPPPSLLTDEQRASCEALLVYADAQRRHLRATQAPRRIATAAADALVKEGLLRKIHPGPVKLLPAGMLYADVVMVRKTWHKVAVMCDAPWRWLWTSDGKEVPSPEAEVHEAMVRTKCYEYVVVDVGEGRRGVEAQLASVLAPR